MINRIYRPPVINNQPVNSNVTGRKNAGDSFEQILNNKMGTDKLSFSAHANKRLDQRGIQLTNQQLNDLNKAVETASSKGSKESLVVMNDLSFIVNVKNKTVITAVDGSQAKNNVFTNIDSAILL